LEIRSFQTTIKTLAEKIVTKSTFNGTGSEAGQPKMTNAERGYDFNEGQNFTLPAGSSDGLV
jgi:hypothetical protein